jgi:hypothetical protein
MPQFAAVLLFGLGSWQGANSQWLGQIGLLSARSGTAHFLASGMLVPCEVLWIRPLQQAAKRAAQHSSQYMTSLHQGKTHSCLFYEHMSLAARIMHTGDDLSAQE